MGLPLVVDIAIGLIFIYLILSLLASEIQEVITTIFQWRAKHLQESIQTLLTGEVGDESNLDPAQKEVLMKARGLTNKLYGHPLIKNLNYQKTGKIANIFRRVTNVFKKFFGDDGEFSGPSKIPSETFAAGILETLRIDQIVREVNEEKVDGFRDRISEAVDQACAHIDDLDPRDPRLPASVRASLNEDKMNTLLGIVVDEFIGKQIALNDAFNRLYTHLINYIEAAKKIPDAKLRKLFLSEFQALKEEIYIEDGRQAIWLDNTKVSVVQVVRAYRSLKEAYYNPESEIAQKLSGLEARFGAGDPSKDSIYEAIAQKREDIRTIEFKITKIRGEIKQLQGRDPQREDKLKDDVKRFTQEAQEHRVELKDLERLKLPYKIRKIINRFVGNDPQEIQAFFDGLPINLMNSMTAIADQTQATISEKIEDVEEDLNKFRSGIEKWFDNGMERANGVFKRNSKGFAFVIGLLVAIGANVDTFYVVNQLSSDSALRSSLAQSAEQVQATGVQPESREDIEATLGTEIEDVDLPIGWSPSNTDQQLIYRMNIKKSQEQKVLTTHPTTGRLTYKNPEDYPLFKRFWGWFKQVGGWLISGVAISMGAPFWFELLNKVVDLKNVGGDSKSDKSKSSS